MPEILESFAERYNFPLDQFQIEAIHHLIEGKSVLVTAPTGSGKTIVAEFAIHDAIERQLKVIYTTPLKALSNQKYRDLVNDYDEQTIGLVTGDLSLNPDAPVVVMTTEILRNILYQDIHRLDQVFYVVIDECHYMNDADRGTVWEEIIIHCPRHVGLVALSATIANATELAAWMSSIHQEMVVVEHLERSVPLTHFYNYKQELLPVLNRQGDINSRLIKIAHQIKQRKQQWQRGVARPKQPKNTEQLSPSGLVKILESRQMLPAIYFIFSRMGCDDALNNCVDANFRLTTEDEKKRIKHEIDQLLEQNPSLKETGPSTNNLLMALPLGLATHHAGLVPMLRHLVEILFQQNLVKVVFATETLAAGINMPARTTVISSLSKRVDQGHRILTVNEFTQMTGRAGRRGKDTEGYCVIVGNNYQSPFQAYDLIDGEYDPIESHFSLSYNMVLNLLNSFDRPQIRTILHKSFGQYLFNKDIINLGLDLERKKKSLEKLKINAETKSYGRHLRSQIRSIQKQINKRRDVYLDDFDALARVLQFFKRIHLKDKRLTLTEWGHITSAIRAQNDLLISRVLEQVDFAALNPVDTAALLSTLIFEPRRNLDHDFAPCSKTLKKMFRYVLHVADELRYVQEEENIPLTVSVEFDFAPIICLWGNGCQWSNLFKYTNMSDGDVVRSMRQLIDLITQLMMCNQLAPDLLNKLKIARQALDRDLVQVVL